MLHGGATGGAVIHPLTFHPSRAIKIDHMEISGVTLQMRFAISCPGLSDMSITHSFEI